MASRIKGITIEIGGDTTGLDKALKGVNGTIRTTQNSLRDVNKLLKLDPKNTTLLSQKQKLLKESIGATKEKLEGLKEAQKQAKEQLERGELGQDKYDALQREIAETEAELKRLEKEAATCESKLTKMAEVGGKMQQAGDVITGAGKKLLPVSGAVAGLGAISVKTAADFDAAMSKVAAVSGATGEDFDKLRAKAREMGSKTKFSASEAAEAMNYMAMAGWKTEDMLSGVEGIMNLAAASGEDLATTSDIVTDALTAFGLSAKDSGHFADVLAAASSNANTNVSMMGESFKYAAPVAGALGISAEDTSIALGLMANAGIKASQSGTSLRTGLTNLAKPTKQMQSFMDKYNIALVKNEDGSVNLRETMIDLREKMGGLSESEQAAAASAIFGKNSMAGWLAIINASDKDFDKLTGAIDNCDGTALDMAETMQDNLMGQITILKSQLQELAISFGDALMPMIRKVVAHIQAFIDKLNDMSDGQRRVILIAGAFIAALAPMLVIIGSIISKVGLALQGFAKLGTGLTKVSGAISKAGGMTSILSKAFGFLVSPVGLVIAAVAVLVAAFIHLWKTNEKFRKSMIAIWNGIRKTIGKFVSDVKSRFESLGVDFSKVAATMKKIWEGFCKILAPLFEGTFKIIAAVLKTVLDVIIGVLDIFIGIFTGDWKKVWKGVKEIFTGVWNGIKSVITAALGTIKKVTNVVLGWFGTSWRKIWNGIKSFTTNLWNGIKNTAKSVFNAMKTVILTPIKAVRSTLSSLWSGIRSAATSVWRGLRSAASSTWNAIKNAVTSPIKSVRSTLSSLWGSIRSTASSAWSGIKNAMISPINSAKSTISGIVSKIKGFFPLSIGRIFTGLKLPHISVSGGKAPFGIGGKGSLPSFHVSWYAKAMEKGMILNSPTIFGMKGNALLGGGEAGSETIVGTDSLMNMITAAVSGIGEDIVNAFLTAGKMQTRGDININVEVNGAENPEEWGKRLVRQMKLEMRTV
ncbi:MAG: phage tail tape measure protein [Hornefia butyriciproducens]|uniref:phage tail tape measure protein n=1 Tax=Hornefia butyriciproducens TaxID=2652293 RepID=UPI002A75E54D|nr:phage tail tape measure protein [Hornefia butyriciproducens]MDY2990592.1 phage tail tape measure protein [Hornefia butyriciproducens]